MIIIIYSINRNHTILQYKQIGYDEDEDKDDVYETVEVSYDGKWRRDKPHGKGITRWSYGDTVDVHEGQYHHGVMRGYGEARYGNGNTYTGEWKHGKRHGKGLFEWSLTTSNNSHQNSNRSDSTDKKGDSYEGSYVKNRREGYGVYKYSNGDVYKGQWKRGKKDGRGAYVSMKHRYTVKAEWKQDKIVGGVTIVWMDGDTWRGEFKTVASLLSSDATTHDATLSSTLAAMNLQPNSIIAEGMLTFYHGDKLQGRWIGMDFENGIGEMTIIKGDRKMLGTWKKRRFSLLGQQNTSDNTPVLPATISTTTSSRQSTSSSTSSYPTRSSTLSKKKASNAKNYKILHRPNKKRIVEDEEEEEYDEDFKTDEKRQTGKEVEKEDEQRKDHISHINDANNDYDDDLVFINFGSDNDKLSSSSLSSRSSSLSSLSLSLSSPASSPSPPPSPIVNEDGSIEYVVEDILQKRRLGRGWQYLVKWSGYKELTWEPYNSLSHLTVLKEFEAKSKTTGSKATQQTKKNDTKSKLKKLKKADDNRSNIKSSQQLQVFIVSDSSSSSDTDRGNDSNSGDDDDDFI